MEGTNRFTWCGLASSTKAGGPPTVAVVPDDDRYCYLVDRKKEMFISGGENIYPAQIEHLLGTHPKVADVAVIGKPHPRWDEVGCAVVVVRPGETLTAEDLLVFCSGKIAKFKIPQSVVSVSELPRTMSGKVRKQILKQPAY